MSFIYKQIEGTYAVWFAPANRYMQLQKPAFRILQDWTNKLPESQIIRNCAHEFKLPMDQSLRFVLEVTEQFRTLINNYKGEPPINPYPQLVPLPDYRWYAIKYYRINGKAYRFRYRRAGMEKMIHPGFSYLEHKTHQQEADHTFDLFDSGDQLTLQTEGQYSWSCANSKPEQFIGLVYMQLLNCIHHTTDAHWMGAVHASAVSAGMGAILFTAPSGSGKSTFAALLMNKGYQVLSDDYSPLSLTEPKVYPFPEGISVKDRSLQVLQSCYPTLAETRNTLPEPVREVFLPLTTGELPAPEPVKAIVFLEYNPAVELELIKIPNLGAMDRMLQQLWLPPTAEVATAFMDWYFQTPTYTLRYSDTGKASECVSTLFQ